MPTGLSDFDVIVILLIIAVFLFGAWLGRFLTRYPFGRRPYTGMESLVGKMGTVKKVRNEIMEIEVQSQIWVSDIDPRQNLKVGDQVVVDGIEGVKVKVRKE